MSLSATRIGVAVLAVGAATASVYLALGHRSEKVNLNTYEVLGAVTAEETARLIGNKGQVVVMVRDTGPDKNPSVEAQLAAFQKTLGKLPEVSVLTERVQVNSMMMMSTGGGLPPELLFKALQAHPNLGALVLFFGFPQLTEPELFALNKTGVKLVVVSSFRPGYQRLIERKAIHLALVPKPEPPPADAPPAKTVRERFDQEYMILTAARPAAP